jgi:flagellar biogenesis protein FliO
MKGLARRKCVPPRLEVLERLSLAPRQSLTLVKADGRRILVATSGDGGLAFYPLDSGSGSGVRVPVLGRIPLATGRMSW